MNADGRRSLLSILLLLAVAVAPAVPAPAAAQERKIEPVDEAGKDASWNAFRKRLFDTLEKRDRKQLLSIVSSGVRNGSDSPRGVAEFRKQWAIDDDDSPIWSALRSALSLGSAWFVREKKQRELCAPYVLAKWPEDVDFRTNGVIVAREALAKSAPTSGSETLATLAYQIVPVSDWELDDTDKASKQKWVKIRLNERDAYVPEEQIRSPIEHAACFIKTEFGWRLTVFGPAGRD